MGAGEVIALIILMGIFLVIFILGDMHRQALIKDEADLAEEEKLEKVNDALGRNEQVEAPQVVETDPGKHQP